jgi:Domain of unknown function (DUF5122) beta-propeller
VVNGNIGGGFALARYRVDGSLDPSFDGDRTMTADFGGRDYGQAAPVTAGGKIVVAGGSATTIALTRYWLHGSSQPITQRSAASRDE